VGWTYFVDRLDAWLGVDFTVGDRLDESLVVEIVLVG